MPLSPDVFTNLYKPDVLMCLADLSNDEVFTPPDVANQVLDMLPQELFRNPNTKFLDPALKSGVFLREIAKRLIAGLADKIPNLQERCDWIFKNQLYGIAITELTSLLGRRSVYCSKYPNSPFSITKFDDVQGNIVFHKIRHKWDHAGVNGKCVYCGTGYDGDLGDLVRAGLETHAYEFIHTIHPEEIWNMKFDVILSNPPYQLSDGGAKASAKPIYHLFIQQAKKLNPRYITMIIPAKWFSGGKGLDEFRNTMLNDRRITTLVDYADSKDCFPGVDVAGGICYFLWERDKKSDCKITNYFGGREYTSVRPLNEYDTFIRYSEAVEIIRKVESKKEATMDGMVTARKPFGIDTNCKPDDDGELDFRYSKGLAKINRGRVTSGSDMIKKWKTIVSYTGYEHAGQPDTDGSRRVLSVIEVLPPNTVCSETYLVAGAFRTKEEAENLASYLRTKFVRFLVGQKVMSQHVTRGTFSFVPVQDFCEEWTDSVLYKKYGLSDEEIDFIERTTKPMPERK